MFQKILVPFDLSESARSAFGHAVVLAQVSAGTLDLLHVVEPHQVGNGALAGSAMALAGSLERQALGLAEKRLGAVAEQLAATHELEVRAKATVGVLPDAIAEEAKALESQLIVVATHGHTGVKRWLLGSVTERLLRVCATPVLVARGGEAATTPLISRLAVAIDFSEHSLRALDVAEQLQERTKAELTLVHALPNPSYVEGGYVDPRPLETLAAETRGALDRLIEERSLKASSAAVVGSPSRALETFVRETPTDLLILGTHGRRGLSRALLGSVAELTVRYASCACLVVP